VGAIKEMCDGGGARPGSREQGRVRGKVPTHADRGQVRNVTALCGWRAYKQRGRARRAHPGALRHEMNDVLLFVLFFAGWFLLVRVVLPRLGAPT